jgi:hypothetical protein
MRMLIYRHHERLNLDLSTTRPVYGAPPELVASTFYCILGIVPANRPKLLAAKRWPTALERVMTTLSSAGAWSWRDAAVIAGRLLFLMAVTFKILGMRETADFIAAASFPAPLLLAWLAAVLEVLLVLAFLTGAYF